MRTSKHLLLGCLYFYSIFSFAQEGVYIGGFYESVITDDKKKDSGEYDYIDDGDGPGLELGVLFTPSWGARIEWAEQDYNRGSILAKGGNKRRLGLDLMYRFTEKNHLYTFAGFKSVTPGDGHSVFNLGLGASLPFASRWSLFAEGAVYQGMSETFTDYGIKGGIRYRFYTSEVDFIHPHKPVQTVIISTPRVEEDPIEQVVASIRVNVFFPNDSSFIEAGYYPEIKKVADFMENNPETLVEIGGHTSAPASAAYNLKLSQARAEAIAEVLVDTYKIEPLRISAKGYGKSRLLDLNDNEQAHRTNRRIEAVLYSIQAKDSNTEDK